MPRKKCGKTVQPTEGPESEVTTSQKGQGSMSAADILENQDTSNPDRIGEVCRATTSGIQKSEKNEKAEVEVNGNASVRKNPTGQKSFGKIKVSVEVAGFGQSEPAKFGGDRRGSRKRFSQGVQQFVADQHEDCDCLEPGCPGCHFPCQICGDTRCGKVCRKGRKWLYQSVEVEGRGVERQNPHCEQ